MQYEKANDEMRAIITQQLGREPRGLLGVSRFCVHGFPQVIVSRPVFAHTSEIEVFPTLYWLTCPYLCKEVAVLETDGLIAEFEKRIETDPDFAAAVEKNHGDYAKRRLDLIPEGVQERIKTDYPKRYKVLAETGVGGTRNPTGVKCLHTHLADYLVHGENIIGRVTAELINKPLHCAEILCESYRQK